MKMFNFGQDQNNALWMNNSKGAFGGGMINDDPKMFPQGPWGNMQSKGGFLGRLMQNPQLMQMIQQGMPNLNRNPGTPMLPNENRVPMNPNPSMNPNPRPAPYMPRIDDTPRQNIWNLPMFDPNYGKGTGSNNRDSSDWAARHPEEQQFDWLKGIKF